MIKEIKNVKIYDKDLHLKSFGKLCELASNKYQLFGYTIEVNSITGEIIWTKMGIDIYATPFISGDNITFHIMNDYYIEMESVSLRKEKIALNTGDMSTDDFIETYIDIVKKKIIEWKLQK